MIGIFDSGMGGLSVLRAIKKRMPDVDILYFGDIKNAPYGIKTQEQLSSLTIDAVTLLRDRGAQKIVSACNSVSASLVLSLFDTFDISSENFVEMVGPTVSHFKNTDEKTALCATPATIHSGIYQSGFKIIGKDVTYVAIPELAGAIEFGQPQNKIEAIVRQAFSKVPKDFDTLILSCTHYPLVSEVFAKTLGPSVRIYDPSDAVATRVSEQFTEEKEGSGNMHFLISKDSEQFRDKVATLFADDTYTIEVLD